MKLRDYLLVLRRRWAIMVAAIAVCVGAAAAITFAQVPQYEASTRLFVSAGGADEVGQAYQGGLFVQQRVQSYLGVISSPSVLEPVRDELGIDESLAATKDRVRATSPLDTVLIDLEVTSPDSEEAATLANAVAGEFAQYVEELESRAEQDNVPVKVTVVEPATVPQTPISPTVVINLALGLLAGVAVGVGAVALREALDTTAHSTDEIEALVQAPILADIPFDSTTDRYPLLRESSRSPRAEAFRGLRTNLRYVDVDNPIRVVVVTSAASGEGKSGTAANLALALARSGQRVVLVEGDLRRPQATELFGIVEGAGLTNVLVGATSVEDVIQTVPKDGLDVLPCGPPPPNPSELLSSHQMSGVLDHVRATYDMVVIDAPPLLAVTDAAVLARAADGAVLVVRRSKTKREQLSAAVESLNAVNARVLGAVINMSTAGRAGPNPYVDSDPPVRHRRRRARSKTPDSETAAAV